MRYLGFLTVGIVSAALLLPSLTRAAPGLPEGHLALRSATGAGPWTHAIAPLAATALRTVERSGNEWAERASAALAHAETRRAPARTSGAAALAPATRASLWMGTPSPRALPPATFLQRAYLQVANLRPDVTLQSVPGHGGLRVMLAVDTLSLLRR